MNHMMRCLMMVLHFSATSGVLIGLGSERCQIGLVACEKLRVHESYDSLFNDGLTSLSNWDFFWCVNLSWVRMRGHRFFWHVSSCELCII